MELQQKTILSEENVDYQQELDELKTYLVSEPSYEGVNLPRFGMLSIYGRSVPMFAYDHPALLKQCRTAFTDSQNIFFSVPFMEKILEDERGGRNGMLFLALHEIGHNAFRHFFRLTQYPGDIANRAQDLSMNTRFMRDFVNNPNAGMNTLSPLPKALTDIGLGFKPGDIEKYSTRSEEDIGRELMEQEQEMIDKLKEAMKNQKPGQPGQKGQGQPGGGKGIPMPGEGGDPGDDDGQGPGQGQDGGDGDDEGGDPSKGQGNDKKNGGGAGDDEEDYEHLISPDQLARILKEAGLGHVIDKLNMPVDEAGNIDSDKLARQNSQQMTNVNNAHGRMSEIKEKLGDRMPGAHCHDYATQTLGKLNKPKISWKTAAKQNIIGTGMKVANTFDVAGDAYYIDPVHMGMSNRLWIGARVPAKPSGFNVAILDTSRSMNDSWMLESASEVFGLVAANRNTAPDLLFYQVDTVIRGEPAILSANTVDKFLKEAFNARGLGGTSLTEGIKMVLESPEVKKRLKRGEKLHSLTYFTDLGDRPPQKKDLPASLPKKVLYLASPGTYNDQFAEGVKEYASVVSMGDRMDIDLTAEKVVVSGMRSSRRP